MMSKKYTSEEGRNPVKSPQDPQSTRYSVGSNVPVSGIYRAVHGDHRLAHEVTLLADLTFPRCKKCGSTVFFELVAEANPAVTERAFRVALYEIPHPDFAAGVLAPKQVA